MLRDASMNCRAVLPAFLLAVSGEALMGQVPATPGAVTAPACDTYSVEPVAHVSLTDAVTTLLRDPDTKRREHAAWSIAILAERVGGRRAGEGLVPGRPPEKDYQQALRIAVYDPARSVRLAAVCSLGRVGDSRAIEHLAARARDTDPSLREAAVWATARIQALPWADFVVFENATIIDGTGAPPFPNMSLLIRDGRIHSMGRSGTFTHPRDAPVIDASGKYIIPGLWDTHVHLSKTRAEALPVLVASGITSVRDMGGELDELRALRRRIDEGTLVGPRILLAGPMLESPATIERLRSDSTRERYWITRVAVPSVGAAARIVDSIADLGADFIKVRETASLEVYASIAAAARARRIPMAGHAPFGMDPVDAATLGVVTFEHASFPYPLDTAASRRAEILAAFRRAGVAIAPTFTAWRSYLMHPDSLRLLLGDSLARRDARRATISDFLAREWGFAAAEKKPPSAASLRGWCGFLNRTGSDIAAMHEAGIPILPGTDLATVGLFPGWALHDELALLVGLAGLTPHEAIQAATRLPARQFGLADSLGTIAPGMLADLVLLEADPLHDIRNTRRIWAVVRGGRVIPAETLAPMRGGVDVDYASRINLLPGAEDAQCRVPILTH